MGSIASSLASIATVILHGEVGKGRPLRGYGFPIDKKELKRMDIYHAKYRDLLEKRYFLSPIGNIPKDLRFGVLLLNYSFEIDGIKIWTWKDDTADFIFSRDLILSIRDFLKLIDHIPRAHTMPHLSCCNSICRDARETSSRQPLTEGNLESSTGAIPWPG
ncbi:hypothetical protein TOPH_08751 [Tolypocladium ophioglossoides CBS 100239]|uniref:Uncharacterized protein n=1 Tax=Tolypocladium ophioglossoides (strain CBS 100239) TaxID=1163406 RepID=A0A0L0MXL0_TOLOC|nr:hypothetical protein TOPH_08751 [Tolypocladium ophioglossoides CBS 100239]